MASTLAAKFAQAKALHQQGQLARAQALCREILGSGAAAFRCAASAGDRRRAGRGCANGVAVYWAGAHRRSHSCGCPFQSRHGPAAARRLGASAIEFRQGRGAQAGLCSRVLQPRQCAQGTWQTGSGARELRSGGAAATAVCTGALQPRSVAAGPGSRRGSADELRSGRRPSAKLRTGSFQSRQRASGP